MKPLLYGAVFFLALAGAGSDALAWTLLGPDGIRQAPYVHKKDLQRFFKGNPKGEVYAGPERGILDAFFTAFDGPQEKPVAVGADATLVAGCQAHQCAIKGAVVMAQDSGIRAAALIQFNPQKTRSLKAQSVNKNVYQLTVFIPDREVDRAALQAILQWAGQAEPGPANPLHDLTRYETRVVLIKP